MQKENQENVLTMNVKKRKKKWYHRPLLPPQKNSLFLMSPDKLDTEGKFSCGMWRKYLNLVEYLVCEENIQLFIFKNKLEQIQIRDTA